MDDITALAAQAGSALQNKRWMLATAESIQVAVFHKPSPILQVHLHGLIVVL